jgi:hypothetical protein
VNIGIDRLVRLGLGELAAAVRMRPVATAVVLALLLGGIAVSLAGSALGAIPICTGVFLSGFVDRRLPCLAAVVLLPSLTVFHPLVLTDVDGSILNFRLLLTGGIGIALAPWVIITRPRIDGVGWIFIALVAVIALGGLTNREAPLKALPVIARFGDYLLAYLLARRTLGSPSGVILVLVAIAVGAIVPAISGLVQFWVGNTMDINGATRVTGVYATSPVGLALAMQLAALALATIALRRLPRRSALLWIGVLTFLVLTLVLDETASRLVFVSFVLGLIGIEILDRRWVAIPVIVLGTVVALALQPDLANRIATTGRPSESGIPDGFGQGPTETLPPDIETELEVHGDSSLRFRIYVWTVMLDEWRESPFVGRGTGTFATILQARSGMERVAPHNDYLGILLENGIPGLVLYLGLQLAVLLALLRRFLIAAPTERGILAGVAACFVTLNIVNVINNAVLFLDLQITIWVLIGATLGLTDEAADAPDPGTLEPAVVEGTT